MDGHAISNFVKIVHRYAPLKDVRNNGVTRVGVTRGATQGVTPTFSFKKLTTFFAHHCHFYWFHSGVIPWRVSLRTFFTCPILFVHYFLKFAHTFFSFGRHPLEGPGAVPPSDATGEK